MELEGGEVGMGACVDWAYLLGRLSDTRKNRRQSLGGLGGIMDGSIMEQALGIWPQLGTSAWLWRRAKPKDATIVTPTIITATTSTQSG